MHDNPSICATCDNVTARTRQLDGWRWRCLMFPVPDMDHHLGPGIRATHPNGRCLDKNFDGRCPDWTPVKGKFEAFEQEIARV